MRLTGLLGILLIALVAGGCGAVDGSRCLSVSGEVVRTIEEGLRATSGGSLRKARAVRSNEFEHLYFVSAYIHGVGLEGSAEIGTWATDSIDQAGDLILAIDEVAKAFSRWTPGDRDLLAPVTMSSDGARASSDCTANAT
jgi:hypothetical protein